MISLNKFRPLRHNKILLMWNHFALHLKCAFFNIRYQVQIIKDKMINLKATPYSVVSCNANPCSEPFSLNALELGKLQYRIRLHINLTYVLEHKQLSC